jgi:hypothetical protein
MIVAHDPPTSRRYPVLTVLGSYRRTRKHWGNIPSQIVRSSIIEGQHDPDVMLFYWLLWLLWLLDSPHQFLHKVIQLVLVHGACMNLLSLLQSLRKQYYGQQEILYTAKGGKQVTE